MKNLITVLFFFLILTGFANAQIPGPQFNPNFPRPMPTVNPPHIYRPPVIAPNPYPYYYGYNFSFYYNYRFNYMPYYYGYPYYNPNFNPFWSR